METITIRKEAIHDLVRLKNDFDAVIESLELIGDPQFMESYQKSRNQIKKREFVNWDEL